MTQYKVGDKVRIRQWDDMVAEFGTDADGDIPIDEIFFSIEMRDLCGREFVVHKTDEVLGATVYLPDSDGDDADICDYSIIDEMLERVYYESEAPDGLYSIDEIEELLLTEV